MAIMTTDGMTEFAVAMEEIGYIPDDVLNEMLQAQADVIEPAQKKKGRAYGVHRTGVTLDSIRRGKPKKTRNGKAIYVSPEGTNSDGNRNAEVAFINEFGKHGQAPRPFIRDANEEHADEAVEASAKVLNDFYDSKGL